MNQVPVTPHDATPAACADRLLRVACSAPLRLTAEGGGMPNGPYTISPEAVVLIDRGEARTAAAHLRALADVLAGWSRYRESLLAAEFDAGSHSLAELLDRTDDVLKGVGLRPWPEPTADTITWAETAEMLRAAGWTTDRVVLPEGPYQWRSPDGVSRTEYRSTDPDTIPEAVMRDALAAGVVDFIALAPAEADEPVEAGDTVQ